LLVANGADFAGTGIKVNPAAATAAPPSMTLKISRRSMAVIGFLPTNNHLRYIDLTFQN
jgi:hypothetical protein